MLLYHAESLGLLTEFPAESIDLVNADPPYSSGGLHRSDRVAGNTLKKYLEPSSRQYATFAGDARDQRSWTLWSTLWLSEVSRVMKPGASAHVFTDWRQLPALTDAVQAGGLTFRSIVPWDKGGSARAPHTGYHRHQCEYALWATKGVAPKAHGRGPFPGVLRHAIDRDKLHPTAKPVAMLDELMPVAPPDSLVLDPFMGSGSAGVAAIQAGHRYIGIEQTGEYFEIAAKRIQEVLRIERSGRRAA
ncbi:MAG: site-specific DNA-methyltransferase [Planctomycetota bacterium]